MKRPLSTLLLLVLGLTGCEEPTEYAGPRADQAAELADDNISAGFSHREPSVRAETTRLIRLSGLAETYRSSLRAQLNAPEFLVRFRAIEALLPIDDEEAQGALIDSFNGAGEEEKLMLIDLAALEAGDSALQRILERGLRDGSEAINRRALEVLTHRQLSIADEELRRWVDGEDPEFAEAAIRVFKSRGDDSAAQIIRGLLNSSSREERERGLVLARHAQLPELWPLLRTYVARGDENQVALATIALGHLGDESVSTNLRELILSNDSANASAALTAMSHLNTAQTTVTASRYVNSDITQLRRSAFEIMSGASQLNFEDIAPFLGDADIDLAAEANIFALHRFANEQVSYWSDRLSESENPQSELERLFRMQQLADLSLLIERLETVLGAQSSQPMSGSNLATRLRLLEDAEVQLELTGSSDPEQSYILLEYLLQHPNPSFSDELARLTTSDYGMIRLAASLAIKRLGDDFDID